MSDFDKIFSSEVLEKIFPKEKTDAFFEALFGDSEEGAYDITLKYRTKTEEEIIFDFNLDQRPGKCLVCSLTYGLPKVFSKHPVINIDKIVQEISDLVGDSCNIDGWKLGSTVSLGREKHLIPLHLSIS